MDIHSQANLSEVQLTHLSWDADIDFGKKTIKATARWNFQIQKTTNRLILDTRQLLVHSVKVDNREVMFEWGSFDPILGSPLIIHLDSDNHTVEIAYETSPEAEALMWLNPAQTKAGRSPFLFSQSQAILARSWMPCQDSPGVRFTYEATVKVPPGLLALMSASNPQTVNAGGIYSFEMKQPIPSYLLALCVGDVAFSPVSDRCGIYAEPCTLDSACHEFADLERMVQAAEELYGPYPWERYDLIVLPPSFPFGGMENPRLTFVTPTILAGDRSLTSLVAHELAHSWSGNLVTNATWIDFWLNEGFTVYFETRIVEKLYGKDAAEMLALLNLGDLTEEIRSLNSRGLSGDTRLRLNLKGRSPDEGVTDIAYNKGYYFLRRLEELYGRDKFDAFVKDYFSNHGFRSMDTDRFRKFIHDYYESNYQIQLDAGLLDRWIEQEGLPEDCPTPVTDRFELVHRSVARWVQTREPEPQSSKWWTAQEWLYFLRALPDNLNHDQLISLDAYGKFSESGNAEIMMQWSLIAIRNNYTSFLPRLRSFLIETGRRKFLMPLYEELMKSEEGRNFARSVYEEARPGYHSVATNSLDRVVK